MHPRELVKMLGPSLLGRTEAVVGEATEISLGSGLSLSDGVLNFSLSVESYGAVGDGVTDDTAAIQAAIDACEAAGGGSVLFDVGLYKITSTLLVEGHNISLIGKGSGYNNGSPVYFAGYSPTTGLVWGGANGGTMVEFTTPAAANWPSGGGEVRGITFLSDVTNTGSGPGSGANVAANGLVLTSRRQMVLADLFFVEFGTDGLLLTTRELANAVNNDTQFIYARHIKGVQYYQTGCTIRLDADVSFGGGASWVGNSSLNEFSDVMILCKDKIAIIFGASDNNDFRNITIFQTAPDIAVEFRGSNGTYGYPSNCNIIRHLGTNGDIVGRGTDTYDDASTNNILFDLDKGNGTPDPTLGTDATLYFTTNFHIDYLKGLVRPVIGGTDTEIAAGRAAQPSTNTLYLLNAASDHIRLDNSSGVTWGIGLNGNNLRFVQFTGSAGLTELGAMSVSDLVSFAAGAQASFGGSTTARAPIKIDTGAAPSAPVDGDIWRENNTNTGLKIRINGVTKTIVVA